MTLQLYFNDVMSQAYDVVFRERAVAAYNAGEGGYHDLARVLGVGYRTLQRWVAQERATGSVAPRPNGGGWRCPIDLRVLEAVVREAPDATVAELCWAYNRRVPRSAQTTRTSFGRAMRREAFVLKKNARGRASGTDRTSRRSARRS
ncbi:MAG TPA: helix-turn-helix domain-containing protein [Gemmatimonadales bacterium]|nr:helix-turn-helix domain-containing protein [Gemmatimonadales bacterium]